MTHTYKRECNTCRLKWFCEDAMEACPRCEAVSKAAEVEAVRGELDASKEANARLHEMRRDYIRAFAEPMRDGETVPDFARRCIETLEAERDALACLNGKEPMNGSFADACGVLASEFRREQAARIAAQEERDQHDKARCELKREVVELRAATAELSELRIKYFNLQREVFDLTTAAQNDAYDGAKFVGVFEVRGEKHLGYRHDGEDETITPMRASSYPYERGGSDPMLVILYKKDAPDEDDDGDERYMGVLVNDNDYDSLLRGVVPQSHLSFSEGEKKAVEAAYEQFVLNTKLVSDDSVLGRQRSVLTALVQRWGYKVTS